MLFAERGFVVPPHRLADRVDRGFCQTRKFETTQSAGFGFEFYSGLGVHAAFLCGLSLLQQADVEMTCVAISVAVAFDAI